MGLTKIQGPRVIGREKSASQIFKENLATGAGQAIPRVAEKLLGGVIEKSLAPTGAMGRGLMTEEAIRNMELNALASRDHQRAVTGAKRAEQPTKRYEAAQKTRQEVVKGAAGVEQERTKGDGNIEESEGRDGPPGISLFGQVCAFPVGRGQCGLAGEKRRKHR